MISSNCHFLFKPLKKEQEMMIHAWFKQAHVEKWFYGKGRENVFEYLHDYLQGSCAHKYWIAFDQERPVALFMTTTLDSRTAHFSKWCKKASETLIMDALIGDTEYLGKGLAKPLVIEFLKTQFPKIKEVLVALEASHSQAIHIYERVGFEPLCEFTPSYSDKPHLIMHLDMAVLKKHDYHLEWQESPSPELETTLMRGLSQAAFEKKKMKAMRSFGISLKGSSQEILGGITGALFYGSMHIDQLWIEPTLRYQGWGTTLMGKVEHMAKVNGAHFVTVHTMDWEALSFYQKRGYEIELKRDGYANSSTMYILKKILS